APVRLARLLRRSAFFPYTTLFRSQILASDIPDAPGMEKLLFDYFPKALHKYDVEIRAHKLRREIIATQIVNELVNRMGPVFVARSEEHTSELQSRENLVCRLLLDE